MVNLTISTLGATRDGECHKAAEVHASRYFEPDAYAVALVLTVEQALEVIEDALAQVNAQTGENIVLYTP